MGAYDTRGGSPISPNEDEPSDIEMAFDTAARTGVTVHFGTDELWTTNGFFVACTRKGGRASDVVEAFIELMDLVEEESPAPGT